MLIIVTFEKGELPPVLCIADVLLINVFESVAIYFISVDPSNNILRAESLFTFVHCVRTTSHNHMRTKK
jgi:hypothetical protein